MRKVLFSIILILVTSSITRAGNFTYGVEWGGSFSAIRYHDYNYLIESGYRMNDSSLSFGGKVNGTLPLAPRGHAPIAQLVEHSAVNRSVQGSSPCGSAQRLEILCRFCFPSL